MHIENLKQGDAVHIGNHNFLFLWFYKNGIDLQIVNSCQIFHVPSDRMFSIKEGWQCIK
jgi:hypothetical protein